MSDGSPPARRFRVASVCHPTLGGSGIVASELALGLAKREHHVHILTTGALARPLPECPKLSVHIVTAPDYPLFHHPPELLAMANAIARVCAEQRIEVLHVHYAVPHASSAQLARQLLGARAPALVTALHGTDVTGIGLSPAYHEVTRMCVTSSDAITTPSAYLRDAARSSFGLGAEHAIDVIENGVDTERFAPADVRDPQRFDAWFPGYSQSSGRLPTLLHISNFRAVKRTRDLIEVFARIHARLPTRLLLIGDGPERAASETRARQLGLAHAVCFLGQRASLREYLQHADAFLLSSETESFGLAALEALSSGLPVFGYRVGGLPAVVTEEVGHLAPPFDSAALADAVVSVLADAAKRDRLAQAARRRAVEHFRIPLALERHEALFERVTERRRLAL